MTPINIYDFSDRLNSNSELRRKFLDRYVDTLINSMDVDDIISSFADQLHRDLYAECREYGADGIVEGAAHDYPSLLEEFDVDTSLASKL